MIVTPGVTDDTPQTALTVNLLEKVLEFRDTTPWTDPYTLRNWDGFAYSPPPNTGFQNPLPNSIVIRDTKIANDIYFVTGSIDYIWVFRGINYLIRDGFFACCRLDKLNDLSAWHMNIERGIQSINNLDAAIPIADAHIPVSDVNSDGGCYGMAVSDGFSMNPLAVLNYTSPADGSGQIAQGVWCHTVGGVNIQNVGGTAIKNALPTAGQLTYPIHHMYYAIPLDGVADNTVLNATLLPANVLSVFQDGTFTITNYTVFGDLCVIAVADVSQSGLDANAVAFNGAQAVPFIFGADITQINSKNYGAWAAGSFMDGATATIAPAANGGAVAFYRDITLTQDIDMVGDLGGAELTSILGSYMAVGWGQAYETPLITQPAIRPLVTIGCITQVVGGANQSGASRSYMNTTATTAIARQSVATVPQQESSDVMQGSYYTGVQQLSTTNTNDEMILLRLYVPQFDAGAKPWANFSHITYHYTNKGMLNADLGIMPLIDITSLQIGPLISSNTDAFTWQTFPTTEERGFQNTNLSNTVIYGTPFARPDSQNIQSGIQNWGVAYNNVPRFSADIRGFCGSYSPVDSTDPLFGTTQPFILTYDTANSSSIVPNYVQASAGGPWEVVVTSSCFFDYGAPSTTAPLQDSVVAEMNQYTAQVVPSLDTTPYLTGGVMNMAYDLDRNQWVISISAQRDGAQNNPAWFMAATSNLSRYAFFKTGGIKNPVLAQANATTVPGGVAQSTSFMFTDCAGGSDTFKAYTLGGNFGSADGVGGTYGTLEGGGNSGPIQLTQLEAVGGKSVVMWVDYLLFDGVDSLIATVVQELGLSVTVENVEWYKRKMISGDVLNMTTEEIEAWVQSQQAEYRKMLIDNERQGRVRRRRRQQSAIAHDLEEQIQGEFVVSEMDFIEGDFIERNLKNISAFPDQDEALKHQIITDEQWNSLDSLYGTPVPKKTTSLQRKEKADKQPKSDAEEEQT